MLEFLAFIFLAYAICLAFGYMIMATAIIGRFLPDKEVELGDVMGAFAMLAAAVSCFCVWVPMPQFSMLFLVCPVFFCIAVACFGWLDHKNPQRLRECGWFAILVLIGACIDAVIFDHSYRVTDEAHAFRIFCDAFAVAGVMLSMVLNLKLYGKAVEEHKERVIEQQKTKQSLPDALPEFANGEEPREQPEQPWEPVR